MKRFLPLSLLLLFPARAMACAYCPYAETFRIAPFLLEWILILGIWWAVHVAISLRNREIRHFAIKASVHLLLIGLGFCFGLFAGLFWYLIGCAIWVLLQEVFFLNPNVWSISRRRLLIYAFFLIPLFASLFFRYAWHYGPRDPLERYLRFSDVLGPNYALLSVGKALDPKSLDPETLAAGLVPESGREPVFFWLLRLQRNPDDLPHVLSSLKRLASEEPESELRIRYYLETLARRNFFDLEEAIAWAEGYEEEP